MTVDTTSDTGPGMDPDWEPPLPSGFMFAGQGDPSLAEATRILAEANAEGAANTDLPMLGDPGPDDVILPGGIVRDGTLARHAEVRELTGEDEEAIARAMASINPSRFTSAALERGVVSIGGKPVDKKLLGTLLIGDRDTLMLGIRKVTYGGTLDVDMICQRCSVQSQVRVDLTEDIPIKPLPWSAEETTHVVPVPSGRHVVMKMATGDDQTANFDVMASQPGITNPELNSLLLQRAVVEYEHEPVDPKKAREVVRKMNGGDRRALTQWLIDNQPGPQYADVKHTCDVCGEEQSLGLTAADLFPAF